MNDKRQTEIEAFIRDQFERNFETLRYESGGHSLTADTKEAALNQVLLYWRKLRRIAEKVTDTEVKLNLPTQTTPKGRSFGIEGVVDIVREGGKTIMYDIKTHDVDYVRGNKEFYEKQLNVYAYIWQNLRGQALDSTAIIATSYPNSLKEALANDNAAQLTRELADWEPLVPLNFRPDRVTETIADFARIVDAIEDGAFDPPPQSKLNAPVEGTNERFATHTCRNCDARFSCDAYRRYALGGMGGQVEQRFRRYYQTYDSSVLQENWKTANLDEQSLTLTDEDLI